MTESSKTLSFYFSTLDIGRAIKENQRMKYGNTAITTLLKKLEKDLPDIIQASRQLEVRAAMGFAILKCNEVDRVMSDYLDNHPDVKEKLTNEFNNGTI